MVCGATADQCIIQLDAQALRRIVIDLARKGRHKAHRPAGLKLTVANGLSISFAKK